ncbi:unnamed protein product [Tuber aestivum]|uniref:Uncharacterized protein n=1 Tax=Tuber aestivum TaxID=59557 RepID=A0A292Q4D8_9PEZI|nr:unnamed protein product [Tuber aestivum]
MTTKLTPTPPLNTAANKKPKLLFTLNTPFPEIEWPTIPPTAQTTIIEHLSNMLSPIGARRRLLPPPPSAAKRNRKRKRASSTSTVATAIPPPPVPEISKYLTVGLNSTTAYLEGLAGERRPPAFAPPVAQGERESRKPAMRAVFVTRADSQALLLHSHIPLLCGLASGEGGGGVVVRLVQLPRGSEARLADALGIVRAGFVGLLEGAPEELVAGLMEVVERYVLPVRVPWLDEQGGVREYKPVNVKVAKTYATVQGKRKRKGKGSAST